MKKNGFLFLLLLFSLLGSKAFAEIDFDLHAQHLSTAIEGKYTGARYELPKSFVSTNLKYQTGYYTTQDNNGYFNVEVKTPKPNWSVSIDVWYYMNSINYSRTIKLVADNGESISVSFASQNVQFDSKKVLSTLDDSERVTVEFTRDADNIVLSINGSKVGTAVRANFTKLKYVEVALIHDYEYTGRYDDLHSLVIGAK